MTSATTWMPYCGAAPAPSEWLTRWNFDPPLLIALALLPLVYSRLAKPDRQRRIYFGAAWVSLLLLFVSPLCALTSALFSARVLHHVLLTTIVAPLLVMALPRREASSGGGSLPLWTAVQALNFWAWHSPELYALALSSDIIFWVMQISLLGLAAGFWSALFRSSPLASVSALLISMVQMGLLGALITFAADPLYEPHFSTTVVWGLAPAEDQQLAGLIMWIPAAGLYLFAALLIARQWLRQDDGLVRS